MKHSHAFPTLWHGRSTIRVMQVQASGSLSLHLSLSRVDVLVCRFWYARYHRSSGDKADFSPTSVVASEAVLGAKHDLCDTGAVAFLWRTTDASRYCSQEIGSGFGWSHVERQRIGRRRLEFAGCKDWCVEEPSKQCHDECRCRNRSRPPRHQASRLRSSLFAVLASRHQHKCVAQPFHSSWTLRQGVATASQRRLHKDSGDQSGIDLHRHLPHDPSHFKKEQEQETTSTALEEWWMAVCKCLGANGSRGCET